MKSSHSSVVIDGSLLMLTRFLRRDISKIGHLHLRRDSNSVLPWAEIQYVHLHSELSIGKLWHGLGCTSLSREREDFF